MCDGVCPTLAELLLATEEALGQEQPTRARHHLERCADCRARVESASAVIDAVDLSMARTLDATIGTPTPYEMFRARLHTEQTRQAGPSTGGWSLAPRRWMTVAAMVPLLVLGLLFSDRYTSTVAADSLLARAALREQGLPRATVQRVRIRSAAFGQITRDVGKMAVNASRPTDAEQRLVDLLARYQFDLSEPLRVAPFQHWRASLSSKQDSVQRERERAQVTLKTTTSDPGDLRSAELVIRESDFRAIRQTLTFESIGQVEIVEMSSWIAEPARAAAPPIATIPEPSAPALSDEHALDDAEIDVRRLLHELSADLDEGVEVVRNTRRIQVRGTIATALEPALRRQLRSVTLAVIRVQPRNADLSHESAESGTSLAVWRARTFPRPSDANQFLTAMSEDVRRVTARASAYRALSSRYTLQEIERMSPPTRDRLIALVTAHRRDLVKDLDAVTFRMGLLIGTVTRQQVSDDAPSTWRDEAAAVGAAAVRLRDVFAEIMRLEDLPPSPPPADSHPVTKLRQAVDAIWIELTPPSSSR